MFGADDETRDGEHNWCVVIIEPVDNIVITSERERVDEGPGEGRVEEHVSPRGHAPEEEEKIMILLETSRLEAEPLQLMGRLGCHNAQNMRARPAERRLLQGNG